MISFLLLLKKKYDEGISSGSIGIRSSVFITYEQGKSELVVRGVKDGMRMESAVDSPWSVIYFTGVSIFDNN
jgi:hypothetical protein